MPASNVTVYVVFDEETPKYNITLAGEDEIMGDIELTATRAAAGDIIEIILPEDFILPTGKRVEAFYVESTAVKPFPYEISKDLKDFSNQVT